MNYIKVNTKSITDRYGNPLPLKNKIKLKLRSIRTMFLVRIAEHIIDEEVK